MAVEATEVGFWAEALPLGFCVRMFLNDHTCSTWKFPGQVLNPCHSYGLPHSSGNARFLTCCIVRELLNRILKFIYFLATPEICVVPRPVTKSVP